MSAPTGTLGTPSDHVGPGLCLLLLGERLGRAPVSRPAALGEVGCHLVPAVACSRPAGDGDPSLMRPSSLSFVTHRLLGAGFRPCGCEPCAGHASAHRHQFGRQSSRLCGTQADPARAGNDAEAKEICSSTPYTPRSQCPTRPSPVTVPSRRATPRRPTTRTSN